MSRYNHCYNIAFSVISHAEDGDDVTPAMLRAALQRRIRSLGDLEWLEACAGLTLTPEAWDNPAIYLALRQAVGS